MQRYFAKEKKDNLLILNEYDLYHIKTVMRMRPNDIIEVVYNQQLNICELTNNYDALIKETKEKNQNKKIYSILCVPVLQEQKMSFVLQKATELGVDEIIPIFTKRSVVKTDGKEEKKIERWNKICKEASEQSKRVTIPIIRNITKIEDLKLDGLKIICSTVEKSKKLKQVLRKDTKIIFAIGPEGGFTTEEEEMFLKNNFIPVTLGQNIMRVETVPIFLLSILNYEME